MAINFPSTAGQATDGTFTYTVAGITYSWNGESWRAAGSGATATDKTIFSVTTASAAGGGSLSYNNNNGVFTFTPPLLSSYITTYGPVSNHTDVEISGPVNNQLLRYNSSTTQWENWTPNFLTSYTVTASDLNSRSVNDLGDVTVSSPSLGQVLKWNGSQWINDTDIATTGLQTRTTASVTASNLTSNGTANVSITTPKTYALLKIETSHAAWVTLYTDTTSRTADSSRNETTDPLPGSGVIAEVITTGATTQLISPGTVGFNSTATGTTYAKIVNKSGATASIVVTLTYVQLEA